MLRRYRYADRERIVEIWADASAVATPFLSAAFLAEERERIREVWLPKAETWVFEADDEVVGFVSLIGSEVGAIFVHPDHQGRGVGRTLMDHAVELRGELVLDVFEANEIGRRFYDRYGFTVEFAHVHEPSGHVQLRMSYAPDAP